MLQTDHLTLQHAYCDALEILQKLNTHLAILDRPLIAVSACARQFADQLENASSASSLQKREKRAIQAYVDDARFFFDSFFEESSRSVFPGICLLRLPCDSHELVKAHNNLGQKYLDLRENLRLNARKLEVKRRAMREPNPT